MVDDEGVAAITTPPAAPRFGRLLRSMPDARLVGRVRAGDEQAFEALFDRYHRPLLAFCRHMLGTREEAEDALQHVFVSAHRSLVSGGDRVVELRPWLYAIARNRCVSVLRARREAVALDDVAEPSAAGLAVAQEVEQREDLRDILGDMARLPDDQRAALVLSELGALSHDEVAEVLGVRRDKVKALVFQARESLAGWREARDADCTVIREQLATLTGGALRRAPLRRHLDTCEGCRGFRGEVRRQREAMALLLPVIPTIALKAKVLGAVAATTHGLPAAGLGAGVAGAGAATVAAESGSTLAALGGGIAGKVLVVAA
ncbi:MAG: polymerase, sigma-24 subunit, subfamily, partial [Solirubrobacterales bacterium]|nr:polymerase, sigma-24 subunit, subfamily [Solirubrobacterales bacterium]